MNSIKSFGFVILIIVLILGYSSMYTVTQGEQALVLRLGKIVDNPATGKPYVMNPGLHFKMPFLNQVRYFDVRLQTLTVQSSRILTAEQKYVLVDYYVKWRVKNLTTFYTRTVGDYQRADSLLQAQLNDALRAAFGKRTITEVISEDRTAVMDQLQQQTNETAENLGIEVVDVRLKTIDLPQEVSQSVFERMSAKREQVAAEHRAAGRASAEAIRATADAQATVKVATARTKAAHIRAVGQAKAANIYAEAYKKNASFYAFYRSLEAYRQAFNKKSDILVIRPDSQFFKYFNSATGKANPILKPSTQ